MACPARVGSSNSIFPGHGPKDSLMRPFPKQRRQRGPKGCGSCVQERNASETTQPLLPPPYSHLLLPHHHQAVSQRDPTSVTPGSPVPARQSDLTETHSRTQNQKSPHLILRELEGRPGICCTDTSGSQEEGGTRVQEWVYLSVYCRLQFSMRVMCLFSGGENTSCNS